LPLSRACCEPKLTQHTAQCDRDESRLYCGSRTSGWTQKWIVDFPQRVSIEGIIRDQQFSTALRETADPETLIAAREECHGVLDRAKIELQPGRRRPARRAFCSEHPQTDQRSIIRRKTCEANMANREGQGSSETDEPWKLPGQSSQEPEQKGPPKRDPDRDYAGNKAQTS
jgi:hypothetical protein